LDRMVLTRSSISTEFVDNLVDKSSDHGCLYGSGVDVILLPKI
jgi:hypothetical protein